MARVLLASFAGYPFTPSSLMPDNGLASLAGALMDAGHDARILDYGTVETVRRLFPRRLSRRVRPLAEKLFLDGRKLSPLQKLRFLEAGMELAAHQAREAAAIAGEVAQQAAGFGAEFVGLKLWNGDGFVGSVRIAEALRERLAGVKILGGGPQVDYFGHHILEYTDAFDALLAGEGERALPELVEAMSRGDNWRSIDGVIWREGKRIQKNPAQPISSLDELPLPAYDKATYPALSGDEKIKIGILDESRGCPNRCAFCIHPIKSGGKWALKSPGRVLAEMRRMMAAMATRYFIYSGSNTSGKVAMGIAEAILREGLDVRYGCFGHVQSIRRSAQQLRAADPPGARATEEKRDLLSPDRRGSDFDLLRRSGCIAIFYGLESASPRILREGLEKPLKLDAAEEVIQRTRQAGICAITSVIFPAPFEDEQSRAETLAFLRRLRPDSVPVTIPGMIPGTPWERNAARYGFEISKRKDIWEYALTYKIKLLFPPSLWKPLPYRLNGKSSKQLFRECERFVAELEGSGILTDVPHEMVLMASALGQSDDLKGFRDRCRAQFLGGDVESIADMVSRINRNVVPTIRAESLADDPEAI